jgi:lysophospholipase
MAKVFANDFTARINQIAKSERNLVTAESTVLIIYTGGTIGMTYQEHGYSPMPKMFEAMLRADARFNDPVEYEHRKANDPNFRQEFLITPLSSYGKRTLYEIHEMPVLLDSSCIRVEHWVSIANLIEASYNDFDAFIILHGTDTMPYTASALSFMLENLDKTVIITGSQVPFIENRNDASSNLQGSLIIAGHFKLAEVCLYFNNTLMRGNRTKKLDNSNFEAFSTPNFLPIATVGINIAINWQLAMRPRLGHLTVQKYMESRISTIMFSPIISTDVIRTALAPPIRGAILLTYGAGNIPADREDVLAELKAACDRGVVLVNITQCIKGGIDDSYHCGKVLTDIGVVSGRDMTIECAVCKLSYLLGKQLTPLQVKQEMYKNLRGELTLKPFEASISARQQELLDLMETTFQLPTQQDVLDLVNSVFPNIFCYASSVGSITIMDKLLELGADVSKSDLDQQTPLHVACKHGKSRSVAWLIEHEVDVNAIDSAGCTPLFVALRGNNLEIADLLASKGALIRAPNNLLSAMLTKAIYTGNKTIISKYLQYGGRFNILTEDGRPLSELAKEAQHPDIARLLAAERPKL